MAFPSLRYVVYHEDEWTGGEVIDQVIYAQSHTEAKAATNFYLAEDYLSPYRLKQQD